MLRGFRTVWGLSLALTLLPLCSGIVPAFAQDGGGGKEEDIKNKRVSLQLENADIRFALRMLFNAVGAQFSLDPQAQGVVTVDFKDQPFQVALETLIKSTASQTPLTYSVENGIYIITLKRPEETFTQPTETTQEERPQPRPKYSYIKLNYLDAQLFALQFGGSYITGNSQYIFGGGGFGGGFGGGGFGGFGGGGFGGGGFGGFGGGGFGGGGLGGFGGGGFGGGGLGGFGGGGFGGFGGGGFGRGGFGGGGIGFGR